MKNILIACLMLTSLVSCAQQKNTSGDILKKAGSIFGKKNGAGLSNEDVIAGLKEALSVGARNSSDKLSALDGFFCKRCYQGIDAGGSKKSRINFKKYRPREYG